MSDNGYGLWALVVFNSLLFIVFAVSFFHPKTKRDWRALGGFSAFVIALFTEMYGYPLTVYLLTGPLAGLVPGVDLSHNAGHLWADLIGWKGDPHLSPFHLLSYVFIGGGFWLIAAAWKVLYAAQRAGKLATEGAYARVRHPQYLGFILIMVGFLLQWPTFATLAMFPVLLVVYRRLAMREERDCAPSLTTPTTTTQSGRRVSCRAFTSCRYTPYRYTDRRGEQMTKISYTVPDMSCGHCKHAVTEEVSAVPGVESVAVDLETKRVTVVGEALDDSLLRAAIDEAGYEAA